MEVNNCPHCNSSKDVYIGRDKVGSSIISHFIYCFNCGMQGPHEKTPDEAMESWNLIPRIDNILKLKSERDWLIKNMKELPCNLGFQCPFSNTEPHCDKVYKDGYGQCCWLCVAERELGYSYPSDREE